MHASSLAPPSDSLLFFKLRRARRVLPCKDPAISLAPSSPMELLRRKRDTMDEFFESIRATCCAPTSLIVFPDSPSAVTLVYPESASATTSTPESAKLQSVMSMVVMLAVDAIT